MKVIKAFPPNWTSIAKVFPVKGVPGILYAYGDTLYNPSGVRMTPWIMAHETMHGQRQKGAGLVGVEVWWGRYLKEPEFRLTEELLAHKAEWREYQHAMQVVGKADGYLDLIAKRLSSKLYGSLISFDEAKRRIEE